MTALDTYALLSSVWYVRAYSSILLFESRLGRHEAVSLASGRNIRCSKTLRVYLILL